MLADSASLSDLISFDAKECLHTAAVILAEVGCLTVAHFRRLLTTTEKGRIADRLASVISTSAGGSQSSAEAEKGRLPVQQTWPKCSTLVPVMKNLVAATKR